MMDLHLGDCLDVLRTLPDCSVDSVVTDPPYGLSFMGNRWDYDVPSQDVWAECLRVLKPGGHLLAFAGTRTQHRMAVRIEDAGFEIRDMIVWVYGSGFPKSLDVSKAIDKAAGAERQFTPVGNAVKRMIPGADQNATGSWIKDNGREYQPGVSHAATDAAKQWAGWGTALKPALEPITVARKPLIGTVAENVLQHGTGALNIERCRIATDPSVDDPRLSGKGSWKTDKAAKNVYEGGFAGQEIKSSAAGRWPANLIHDGSDEVMAGFPRTGKSAGGGGVKVPGKNGIYGTFNGHVYGDVLGYGDQGSAARFFYCAKASKVDRGEGNTHPTVKPTDLMAYLCRLVTPPGGLVLDPFMGSGSTGKAAIREGFRFIGIERDAGYLAIARARIERERRQAGPVGGGDAPSDPVRADAPDAGVSADASQGEDQARRAQTELFV